MLLIEKTEDLQKYCEDLKKEQFITVDLEFMREKTYYAQICLIQVGCKKSEAIIDPLAEGIDLTPFWDIMQNKKIVKVFHSCRQDIEIIYNLSGQIPTPIFDTQIAAMVCGFGEYISYEALTHELLGIELDKTCRLTNWHLRPLDKNQLKYALSDVTHLVNVYEKLCAILKKRKREHWIDEEIQELQNPSLYETNPDDMWLKIKHSSHNNKFLHILQALAKWRELRARNSNVPRQMIIKDDCLVSIAAIVPQNTEELLQARNMRSDVAKGKLGAEIIEVVKQAIQNKNIKIKQQEKSKALPANSSALFEMLKLMLKIISLQEGVVAKIIATDDDLKDFIAEKNEDNNPILKGWRKDIFGNSALEAKNGNIGICYDSKEKKVVFIHTNH